MRTADLQGELWGTATRDYADIIEGLFQPLYQRVLEETMVSEGTMLLDVGCGPGLAAHLAARRGALVSGLDAASPSVAIAQARTARGDFRVGEMENLPWIDSTFDVVTSFNSFQFAADPVIALQEARRVARPLGRVAMAVWGPDEMCETTLIMSNVFKLLPSPPQKRNHPTPLSIPGQLEDLMIQAGLEPLSSGEVKCPFEFPDLNTAVRGFMSNGGAVQAAKRVGAERVRKTITDSMAAYRTRTGRYHQSNTFRYVIASPLSSGSEMD
jgi:SAM-dependent methyltransferase